MSVAIGTSGWSYDHWEPELYPAGLPARERLDRYTAVFSTAELNSSFYRWPGPAQFGGWQRRLPAGFRLLTLMPGWIRVAVEFRHPSWHCEEVFALLAARDAAYCVMSGAALPCILRATTDLVYVRMHGPDHQHLYAGSYSDADLRWWADRVGEWSAAGRSVFVYFNNDGDANAVRNARTLQGLLAAG